MKPTVTDANLILGYLNKDYFLGGEMKVNDEKAKEALATEIADPLGMSILEAASGIFRIINQSMADATKVVSVQRGFDPREYALVSAGGACSIHSCKIAEEVGSHRIIVPEAASVFCALGMLESDVRLDNVKTYNTFIPGIDLGEFNDVIDRVEAQALEELLQEGVEKERATLLRFLDMRYVGQHHEVTVEIPSGCPIEEEHIEGIAESFHAAHERLYTYSNPENPVEIMNIRVTAVGSVEKTGLRAHQQEVTDASTALKGTRQVYFEEKNGYHETPVYDRNLLGQGVHIEGPAVIEERITTVIVHPGWDLSIDDFGNIIMEVKK